MFVRLFIIWYVFFFRFKICLGVNDYSLKIVDILKVYIVNERRDNKIFLNFFLFLLLENVFVLVVFDLEEYMELKIYFEELCFLL